MPRCDTASLRWTVCAEADYDEHGKIRAPLACAEREDKPLKEPSVALDELLFHYSLEPDEKTRSELMRLAEQTGRWEDILRTEAQLFALTDDVEQKLVIARRAAALAEHKLGDRVRAFRGYLSALRLAPEDDDIAAHLVRLAAAIEQAARAQPGQAQRSPWQELARAYETLPADDPVARLLRIADLWARGAGDGAKALDALEQAAALEPTDERIEAALSALGRSPEIRERLCALYLRLLDQATDAQANLRLRLEIATLQEAQGELRGAEEQYQAVLAIDPSNPSALERLEQMLRAAERWTDLAAHLERCAAQRRGPQRRDVLRELASLYETALGKPYEAIDALVRLAQEDGSNPDVHATRARLYVRVGQLSNAVEALAEEARHGDRTRARAAHRRIAEICERELRLPERALEAYRALAELDPSDEEALGALARLLESMGRWKELEAVLRRRAARAPRELRTDLLRRRAGVLEDRLADPEAAANVLKELRSLLPDDPEVLARLLDNLRKAGRSRELAALLAERVSAAERRGAPPAEVAALLCQLGAVQADALGDRAGARRVLERALALAPAHPLALSELARLHLASDDHVAYARVREREAELTADPRRAVASLIEAARVWREQAGDRARASACLERALALDARSWDALAGLLELAVEEKRWESVHGLAQSLLEVTRGAPERAQVLVVLARASRACGAPEEARGLVGQALALAPDSVPALQELAELDFAEQRFEEAERVLTAALAKAFDPPDRAAPLWLLLGECQSRMGKLDPGFRALLEADRLRPGQLPIRLAMGENRYRARQWREAGLHLGMIGHPDADRYPDAVAQGYVHAAVAETRLRRPDKAAALYEAALCYQPGCVPALRALGEVAATAGDRAGAAGYLEREARACRDVMLLERAGDAWAELGDDAAALRAYAEARDWLRSPDAKPTPTLLPKLIERERQAGDLEAAWATAGQLVAAAENPRERARARGVAAEIARARGDLEAARAHWTQAVADDPSDEDALLALAEHGEPKAALEALHRRLAALPEPQDAESRERRAALWQRLGLLRRDLGRSPRSAIQAFERAVALNPALRGQLVELYEDGRLDGTSALAHHRALLAADLLRASSLRAMARIFVESFEADKARGVYQVLELSAELSEPERAWLSANPAPTLEPDAAYHGVLDDADHAQLAHPEARTLAEMLEALYEGAPTLVGRGFEPYGCRPQDRLSPVSPLPAAHIFGELARALGNKKTGLYLKTDRGLDGIVIISQPPTGVLVGPRIAHDTPPGDLRFLLGRALTLTRPEYIFSEATDPKQFAQLMGAVLRAFHPHHARAAASDPMAGQLRKLVPYSVSKRLTDLFRERTRLSWSSAKWRLAVRQTANRMGLLACGELATAMRILVCENEPDLPDRPAPAQLAGLVERSPLLADLLRFAISEEYLRARARLWGDAGA